MVYLAFSILSLCLFAAPTLSMRRIAQVASGPYCGGYGRVVCCDSDHDGLPEFLFLTGTLTRSWDPIRIEVWEQSRPSGNEFQLVYADTGVLNECPVGIPTGNVIPFAAGDVDGDGLTDIVGVTAQLDTTGPDSVFLVLVTIESPDSFSYPCSLTWYYRCWESCRSAVPTYYPPDLDGDGRKEIQLCGVRIWENVSNDSNELAWSGTPSGGYCAFGDFDMDGRMDFATGGGDAKVWKNTGDDQYEQVYKDTTHVPPATDVFMTNDIDRDGRSEFYVTRFSYPDSRMWLYMYEVDGDGNHSLTRTAVDSLSYPWTGASHAGACGDIDGDGIDECIWTTPDSIRVYKAVGNDDLRQVWCWENDHGIHSLMNTVYDVNGDGYNELIAASNAKVSVFEVVAVDLLSPNGGSCSVGDTVMIRWRTNTPPRCDSLSLFLRRDSLWNLDTIARGLPGTDTIYRWVVPSGVPETARVVVIAYGPGWQFDMSDSVITFIGGGVAEGTRDVPLQWSLSVSPNPARGAFTVRCDVPGKWGLYRAESDAGAPRDCPHFPVPVRIGIYDAGGRLVRSLCEGEVAPGRYEARVPSGVLPAGIYFLRLETPGFRSVKKAVVAR